MLFLVAAAHASVSLSFSHDERGTLLHITAPPESPPLCNLKLASPYTIEITASAPILYQEINVPADDITINRPPNCTLHQVTLHSSSPLLLKKVGQKKGSISYAILPVHKQKLSHPEELRPVIIIDPAHGGRDSGTQNGDACEKDIVLEVGRNLAQTLSRRTKYTVLLTRQDDTYISAQARANMAAQVYPTCYITLHTVANSHHNVRGAMIYHPKPPEAAKNLPQGWEDSNQAIHNSSLLLADHLLENLKGCIFLHDEESRELSSSITTLPCAQSYICLGHISNPHECESLQNPQYQQGLSNIITDSIINFVESLQSYDQITSESATASDLGNAYGNVTIDLLSQ